MKKLIGILLVMVLTFGLVGISSAADGTEMSDDLVMSSVLDTNSTPGDTQSRHRIRVIDLPDFGQLVELRVQAHETRSAINLDQAQIEQIAYQDYQGGDMEALQAARAYKPTLQNLRQEIQSLEQTQKVNWHQMRAAQQAGDQERMESILDDIIGVHQQINVKLTELEGTLQNMITALQG